MQFSQYKSRSVIQPKPADAHARIAAGHDPEDDDVFAPWNWRALLCAACMSACLIGFGFFLVKLSVPYLIAWLEP